MMEDKFRIHESVNIADQHIIDEITQRKGNYFRGERVYLQIEVNSIQVNKVNDEEKR